VHACVHLGSNSLRKIRVYFFGWLVLLAMRISLAAAVTVNRLGNP
jgi:hypothetical protein